MAEQREFEFFLLRYVPRAVRERFVDFGIILREKGNPGGFADVRFANDWRELRHIDPQADVDVLEALEREIARKLGSPGDRESLFKVLEESFSNLVQLSPAKACLTEDPAREIELLASIYLNTQFVGARLDERPATGRHLLLNTMRTEFERAAVWTSLMHGMAVEPYTQRGDPFKFDFGYRTPDNKTIKIFHAVSMKASVDAAVLLAARWPKILPKMAQVTDTAPYLTAVVDDGLDRTQDAIHFALHMMEEAQIKVAAAVEMPRIAEVARVELGV